VKLAQNVFEKCYSNIVVGLHPTALDRRLNLEAQKTSSVVASA
jgi:hypothetical protein